MGSMGSATAVKCIFLPYLAKVTDVSQCCSLAMASNKGQCSHSVAPLATGVGRRMERKRQNLVDGDKGRLTEQQTK